MCCHHSAAVVRWLAYSVSNKRIWDLILVSLVLGHAANRNCSCATLECPACYKPWYSSEPWWIRWMLLTTTQQVVSLPCESNRKLAKLRHNITTSPYITTWELLFVLQIDVRKISGISCSTHRFILYLSLDTSSWLLALIAIERYVAVCKPHKYKTIKPATVGLKIISVLILVQVTFNLHVFWTRGKHWKEILVVNGDTVSEVEHNCGYTSANSRVFWTHHQGWMVLIWYCLIPLTIMLVLSILIIRKLRQMQSTALTRDSSGLSATGLTKQANSMTRMLLSVTIYFIVITTPVFMFSMFQYLVLYNRQDSLGVVDEQRIARLELADACVTLLLYLNHSINFFLYCVSGRKFRKELKTMLGCWRPLNKISSHRKTSSGKALVEGSKGNKPEPVYHAVPNKGSPVMLRLEEPITNSSFLNISGL